MLKLDEAHKGSDHVAATLNKIAAALGCPVSAFSRPHSGALAETDELLQLWSMIEHEHEQDRAKVLSFIRSVAPAVAAQRRR